MNCTDGVGSGEIELDLKYCERCGGLWLRRQGTRGVYCTSCIACLAAMPDPGQPGPRKPRRRRKLSIQAVGNDTGDFAGSVCIDYLHAVATVEVWA